MSTKFFYVSTRRRILIVIISTFLIIIALYGFLIEPNHVRLRTVKVHNKAMAPMLKDLKTVQLSDLHIGRNISISTERTLKILNELKPDMILLSGDYVEWYGDKQTYDNAINFLSQLYAPLGIYAVMGDADYSSSRWSCEFCHDGGSRPPSSRHQVEFLRNAQTVVKVEGNEISNIGIGRNSGYTSNAKVTIKCLMRGQLLCYLTFHLHTIL